MIESTELNSNGRVERTYRAKSSYTYVPTVFLDKPGMDFGGPRRTCGTMVERGDQKTVECKYALEYEQVVSEERAYRWSS